MTLAAESRLIVHQFARARTWGDILIIGDRLGLDRSDPIAVYLRELRRLVRIMIQLANTVPVIAGHVRFSAN